MFGALKRGFRSMAGLILVRNVAGELRPKRTLAASRGFRAAARLSCNVLLLILTELVSHCLSNAIHCMGQNIKSLAACVCVRVCVWVCVCVCVHWVWGWISRKRSQIEVLLQWDTNRKWHMADRLVTWTMTSRDLERSSSWPRYIKCPLSRKWLEIETRLQ